MNLINSSQKLSIDQVHIEESTSDELYWYECLTEEEWDRLRDGLDTSLRILRERGQAGNLVERILSEAADICVLCPSQLPIELFDNDIKEELFKNINDKSLSLYLANLCNYKLLYGGSLAELDVSNGTFSILAESVRNRSRTVMNTNFWDRIHRAGLLKIINPIFDIENLFTPIEWAEIYHEWNSESGFPSKFNITRVLIAIRNFAPWRFDDFAAGKILTPDTRAALVDCRENQQLVLMRLLDMAADLKIINSSKLLLDDQGYHFGGEVAAPALPDYLSFNH